MATVLILCVHYPVASGRYVVDALRRLGHTVYTDGPQAGGAMWGLHFPDRFHWTPEPAPRDEILDLVLVMDSDPHVLDLSADYYGRAPIAVYGVDSHVRNYRRPWFKRYFLGHLHPTIMPWLPDMEHLPCGYDPALFTPSPIAWSDRKYDVAVLGVMYPQRMQAVQDLQAAGFKVAWGCGLIGADYRDAHHNSRVALCLPVKGDVAQRVFEGAAMDCLVATPWLRDFSAIKPRGLFIINPRDQLADQIAEALTYGTRTHEAREWVQRFTWDKHAAHILEVMNVG